MHIPNINVGMIIVLYMCKQAVRDIFPDRRPFFRIVWNLIDAFWMRLCTWCDPEGQDGLICTPRYLECMEGSSLPKFIFSHHSFKFFDLEFDRI